VQWLATILPRSVWCARRDQIFSRICCWTRDSCLNQRWQDDRNRCLLDPYVLSTESSTTNTDKGVAATILKGTGSVGTSLIFWALGLLTSGASLAVYLEYASYFPNRSGSEVVYLEQAFPRPKYFFPIAFAVQTVILSFSSGNAIGMQYCFKSM
jgi:hypothetical protein